MKKNTEVWMVYTNEEGLILITDDYEEALLTYNCEKEQCENYASENLEFTGDEEVVLSKIENRFFYRDMNNEELNKLQVEMEDEFDDEACYGMLDEIKYKE
ncbi:MAG: hypothetical protein ACRC1T_05155 [Clostridium chrysemydis]|uniref:hypothetical protein n=1 Tax=Clostridium chrysemydis TaxID=2665504 RepID=UPI003F3BFF16